MVALILKQNAAKMTTLDDLIEYNQQVKQQQQQQRFLKNSKNNNNNKNSTTMIPNQLPIAFDIGTISSRAKMYRLLVTGDAGTKDKMNNRSSKENQKNLTTTIQHRLNNPTALYLYEWLESHPEAYVKSRKQGLEKVSLGHYALLVDLPYAEYIAGGHCNLTILYDPSRSLRSQQYAIGIAKGSPYRKIFNQALKHLKSNGSIEKLRRRYWTNKCD